MPSFGHRHLLRLRGIPRANYSRAVTRAVSTGQMGSDPLNTPMPQYMLRPSPMASTSRLTLDAFLDRANTEDLVMSALSFAAEDELVTAAIAPPPTNRNTSHWIDPSAAYLGLRSSGLFNHHLQKLLPRIRTLYANLRPSGMHQMLVSDLLLRSPDPRALREILQEEADPSHFHTKGDRLRPSLVVQIYRTIAPGIRRRVLPRLSRSALLCVARALRIERKPESPALLSDLFYELSHTTNWEPEAAWPLIEIILRLSRSGDTAEALHLLKLPIQLHKLPPDAYAGIHESHPRAADIMVQSTLIRTLFAWGFDQRTMTAVDDLVTTMMDSMPLDAGIELVLMVCRAAALSAENTAIAWAQETLLRLANDSRFPELPSASINLHIAALPTPQAVEFYSLLPDGHGHLSPEQILRLTLARPNRSLTRRMAAELNRTPQDGAAVVPPMLCALALARNLQLTRWAYNAWGARAAGIDSHTAVSLIYAFTRGARSARNTAFARTVLNDYLETTGKHASSVEVSLTALHGYALIGQDPKAKALATSDATTVKDPAAEHVDVLIRALGESGAAERLKALATEYPLLANRLAQVGKAHGLEIPTTAVAIAASCAARHWGALTASSSLGLAEDEKAYLHALASARKSRSSAALSRFRLAVEAHPDSPMLAPTASAILQRLTALRSWDDGLEVLKLALRDETVDASSVYFTALQREALGVSADTAVRMAAKAVDDAEEATNRAGKVEIFIDSVDGQPGLAGVKAHAALLTARAAEGAKDSRDAARAAWRAHRAGVRAKLGSVEVMRRTLLEIMCEGVDAAVANE